jgi:hypothetical protein
MGSFIEELRKASWHEMIQRAKIRPMKVAMELIESLCECE